MNSNKFVDPRKLNIQKVIANLFSIKPITNEFDSFKHVGAQFSLKLLSNFLSFVEDSFLVFIFLTENFINNTPIFLNTRRYQMGC